MEGFLDMLVEWWMALQWVGKELLLGLGLAACTIAFYCTAWLPIVTSEWGGRLEDALQKAGERRGGTCSVNS